MASNTAILAVRILGDATGATKAFNDVSKSAAAADKATKSAGKSMAGVWTGVAAAMVGCVKASAALEQATVAVNTVFGDQADEMSAWAAGMAQYGLSTAQASAAAAVLGAQMKNAGLSTEQMAVVTQGLIETSTQLATVMGGSATEAVQAMGAAMRGEFDSLERYGITLTADAVAAEVARLASEGYTFASEQQGKMVATLTLIQEQANVILGEGAEQTITMQSATDHLKASVKNLAASIGEGLTPTLGPLIEGLADTIDKLGGAISESDLLAVASDTLAQVLEAVAEILDPVITSALSLAQSLMDKLASFIEKYVQPVLDKLAQVLDAVADALNTVIGFVERAIDAFDRFTDSVHEAIDSLTFWNDTYQESPPPAAVSAPPPPAAAVAGQSAPWSTAGPMSAARVMVTEEQIYRAVVALIMRGDARNGRAA